ncbi:MAG: hypothetical protein AAFU79_36785, partial [Myxococcota bacterium]
ILVVAAGFLPRGGSRRAGLARAAAAAMLGTLFLLFAFHSAGAVERVIVDGERALVLERFPGRSWGERVWTELSLADGALSRASRPPGAPPEAERPQAPGAMALARSLKARLRREGEVVGPVLKQAERVASTPEWAMVAANETIYAPETVFLARFEADGTLKWRVGAKQLGLVKGRFRRAAPVPGTSDWILVWTGWAKDRSAFDRFTYATHAVAVRIDASDGSIRWTSAF